VRLEKIKLLRRGTPIRTVRILAQGGWPVARRAPGARSGQLLRSGRFFFVAVGKGLPGQYQFDFDRDAATEWVLENERLRLMCRQRTAARHRHVNKITVQTDHDGRRFRDLFASPDNPTKAASGQLRDITFNRAYHASGCSLRAAHKKPLRTTRYPKRKTTRRAPHLPGAGSGTSRGKIEKTVRLAGTESIEVDYRVALEAPSRTVEPASAPAVVIERQAFVALNSVAVRAGGDLRTRFCWQAPSVTRGASQPGVKSEALGVGRTARPSCLAAGLSRCLRMSIDWRCARQAAPALRWSGRRPPDD